MARLRYTERLTFRLAPALRDTLEREAAAKDDNLGELVRDILLEHTRSAERRQAEDRR
jgi:hypothetical protein